MAYPHAALPTRKSIRRRRRRWRRWLLLPVLLLLIGLLFQGGATWLTFRTYRAPGELILTDGQRLHLHCIGSGGPTVLLEAGLGGSSTSWMLVQPAVAAQRRVCAYDRAGYGWSGAARGSRSFDRLAAELHGLLAAGGEQGPFVLVGHSYGGLLVRYYAATYPSQVAGLVLVDASHEDQLGFTPIARQHQSSLGALGVARWIAPFGILRLAGVSATPPGLPPEQAQVARAIGYRSASARAAHGELRSLEQSMAMLKEAPPLRRDLPVMVLTHSEPVSAQAEAIWQELQRNLATLTDRTGHQVVRGSDHYIQTSKPEAVVTAILETAAAASR